MRLFLDFRSTLMLALILGLIGCASTPPQPKLHPQAVQAAQLFDTKNYRAASERYLLLAENSTGADQQLYRLLAADSLLHDQQLQRARETLEQVRADQLKQEFQPRHQLVQAELLLYDGHPEQALKHLHGLPATLRTDQKIRAHNIRARAYARLEQIPQQIQELIALDNLLQDDERHLPIQIKILQLLTRSSSQQLNKLSTEQANARGWKELAVLLKSFPNDPRGIISPYSEWRDLYPNHPAIPELLTRYFYLQPKTQPLNIRNIAVLLPRSGQYATAARTIQTGILAAWYNDASEQRPALRFYDSSDTDQIWPLVNHAAEQGADIIIGPLAKPAIRQLSRAGELPVPILALNQVEVDNQSPRNLYQYSLSPEDEARQVAIWGRYKGYFRPALLYPDSRLGQRIRDAFIDQWAQLEAEPPLTQAYNPKDGNLSRKIAILVKSEQRKLEMELAKQQPDDAETEPQITELPMDFIFAIGNKTQLRQIRPLLQFHYAGQLPVLTTSRAWNGELSRQEAFDLKHIQLPEIPWLVKDQQDELSRQAMQKRFPGLFGKYVRLLPMGMDAYNVLPQLRRLEKEYLTPFAGRTGELYLDDNSHLLRNLTWISLGIPPRILGVTPFADTIDLIPMEPADESPASP